MKAVYRYPGQRAETLDTHAKLDILQDDDGSARLVLAREDGRELPSVTIDLTAEEVAVLITMLTPEAKS